MLKTRFDLSEIHEQPWFPRSLRDGVTDALQYILNFARIYRPVVKHLVRAIQVTRTHRLLDLCSGGGGPWVWLYSTLGQKNEDHLEVCLTDKYPNITAYKRVRKSSNGMIDYCAQPVNAARIPEQLSGFRTLFTSFHHFSPKEAAALLQDAVDSGQGIGVFEVPRRRFSSILLTFLMPVGAFLTVPFIRPFRFSLLLWTYVIPIIPFILWFDGILSCLRAYSPAEISEIILHLNANRYTWEVGEEAGWLTPITYMLGYPEKREDDHLTVPLISIRETFAVTSQILVQPQPETGQ